MARPDELDPEAAALYRALGRRIADARGKQGLSQLALARRCRLTRGSVANIEIGRQHPPIHTLWKIGIALELEPRFLVPTRLDLGTSDIAPGLQVSAASTDKRAAKMIAESGPRTRIFIAGVQTETTNVHDSTPQPTTDREGGEQTPRTSRRTRPARQR